MRAKYMSNREMRVRQPAIVLAKVAYWKLTTQEIIGLSILLNDDELPESSSDIHQTPEH
ncbi:MAG: hypothetical protein R2766_04830 [Saprospiraceae bacterium]